MDADLKYVLYRRLKKRLGQAIKTFRLIDKGDRILLGLSGGKDSLSLLDLLGERMTHSNGYFNLEAVHVRMKNIHYETDVQYLMDQCNKWHIPLHVIETGYEEDHNKKRTPCFLCSWNRRKCLFSQAQDLHFNKIALGHHQDDILRTALMNLTFNGSFSTMPVRLRMRKFEMTIIRPLAMIPEVDLKKWAALNCYQPVRKICPFDDISNRTHIESVANEMELLNDDYRHSLWHALCKSGALIE